MGTFKARYVGSTACGAPSSPEAVATMVTELEAKALSDRGRERKVFLAIMVHRVAVLSRLTPAVIHSFFSRTVRPVARGVFC